MTAGPASSAGRLEPVFLTGGDLPFPALVHPPQGPATGIGVVFAPPFGWEDMSSYRPRRMWADALAAGGATVVRIDLPGTGDAAGGPEDPGRVPGWIDAIGAAATHLRVTHGCRRVVAIGIGVGGMLVIEAARAGAPIDDVVLWGVAARGRAVLRQLGLFARMEAEARAIDMGGPGGDDELEPGALAVGGYLLGAESAEALKAIDLRDITLPGGPGRRALLLEQDGISVDAALADALRDAGVEVTESPAQGFGKMMLEPQFSRAPTATIATVATWLAATPAGDGPAPAPDPARAPAVSDALVCGDAASGGYRERFVRIEHPDGHLFGLTTEPLGDALPLRVGFLGGTGHRIGPNRMWVETARRWAARGVPSVRLDFAGIGDAGGTPPADVPALYADLYVDQLRHAVGTVAEPGDQAMVSVALCAAAYWAVQASLADEHRVLPFMLNPGMLSWSFEGHQANLRRHYRDRLFRLDTWRRLVRGEVSWTNAPRAVLAGITAIARKLLSRLRGGGATTAAGAPAPAAVGRSGTAGVLDGLRDRGTPALMVLAGAEPVLDELRREGHLEHLDRWPNMAFEIVPGEADLHTLRPLWLQRRVHAMLDAGLDGELARLGLAEPARPAA
jgi:hypothetical protein